MDYTIENILSESDKKMKDAEDELVSSGFSEPHWILIRRYILSAIQHNQAAGFKALQQLTDSESGADS